MVSAAGNRMIRQILDRKRCYLTIVGMARMVFCHFVGVIDEKVSLMYLGSDF